MQPIFKVPSVKKLPALPLSIVSFVRVTFLSVLVKMQRLSKNLTAILVGVCHSCLLLDSRPAV